MPKILLKVTSENKTSVCEVTVERFKSVATLLAERGILINQYCGGRGTCGKCKVKVNGVERLACKTIIENDATIELVYAGGFIGKTNIGDEKIISENKILENINDFEKFILIDIGTTSLSVSLCVGESVVATKSLKNPQVVFGADVIARILASSDRASLLAMQNGIVSEINNAVMRLLESSKLVVNDIKKIAVCANTVMLHILLGIDPTSIGKYPYTPIFLESKEFVAGSIGLKCECKVVTLPCISSFVGADIMAGLIAAGKASGGKIKVMVDFGTNAEIAVWDSEKCFVAATAAGPCFEGANISMGMLAEDGAISSFSLDSGIKQAEVIGGVKAKGICGSGLIDIIGELSRKFIVSSDGAFIDCEEFEVAEGVILSQRDVREFQLAKGAIRGAIETLFLRGNFDKDKVEAVYLLGGISQKLNLDNLAKTGLLPSCFTKKCVIASSFTMEGCKRFAKGEKVPKVFQNAIPLDLSLDKDFSEFFIDSMSIEGD